MPTNRPARRRQRRTSIFSPAELQFLTGEPHTRANKFELVTLVRPRKPADFDRIDGLLCRADGVITSARRAELHTNSPGLDYRPNRPGSLRQARHQGSKTGRK